MQPQNQEQKKDQMIYEYCYNQNNPYSLTMTKKPNIIYEYLFKQCTYIWINADTKILKYTPQQIQQKTQVTIDFIKSVRQVKQQYDNHNKNVVIISHISLFNQIQTILQPMLSTNKIRSILLYGHTHNTNPIKLKYDINITHVNSQQNVIQQIRENKKYYRSGDFINFISLHKQKQNSNILVKTMYAMIKQQTNVSQMMQKLKELALICYDGYQSDVQQFIKLYSIHNHLKHNQPVHWYTKQTFLYRLVNRILRISKDPTVLFIIQPYFQDLFNNVSKMYKQQQNKSNISSVKQNRNYKNFTCFRGAEISQTELKFFQQNINSYIQNLGFMSASRQQNIAKLFANNVIFEIKVNEQNRKQQLDYGFADLHLCNPNGEQQILFNPLNSFKIIDFGIYDKQKIIYKITLKYGQMAAVSSQNDNEILNEKQRYLKLMGQHQIIVGQQYKIMGQVLTQAGYYLDGTEEYCDKFLEIAQNSKNIKSLADAYYFKSLTLKTKRNHIKLKTHNKKCLQILKDGLNKFKFNKEDKKYISFRIATILFNQSLIYKQQGNYKKSYENLQQCSKIIRQQFGENDPYYASILNCLAIILIQLGNNKKAVKYLSKFQKILKLKNGKKNSQYSNRLNNLGVFYNQLGQYKKAIQCFQQTQIILRQTLGENHLDFATTLNNLAISFRGLGQYQKAVTYLQRCQNIRKQTLGKSHPDYAKLLNNLGTLFGKLNKKKQALEYLQKCQQIYRETIPQNYGDYATILNNICLSFNSLGEHQKSNQYLKRCQKIIRQKLGVEHPDYSIKLKDLGLSLCNMGRNQQGIGFLLQFLQIQRYTLNQYHPQYTDTLNNLSFVYSKIGKNKKSLYYSNKFSLLQKNRVKIFNQQLGQNIKRQPNQIYKKVNYYLYDCIQCIQQVPIKKLQELMNQSQNFWLTSKIL